MIMVLVLMMITKIFLASVDRKIVLNTLLDPSQDGE